MPMSPGEKQEEYLFDYLRLARHCVKVVKGDKEVRRFLRMEGEPKCADAIGLHQEIDSPGPRRFTVAESKGTDMASAVEQLGNAAAGVFDQFGSGCDVGLLLLVPELKRTRGGALSPGNGYKVKELPTGQRRYTLHEWAEEQTQAQARVTYVPWVRWASRVASLPIVVLLLNPPPE